MIKIDQLPIFKLKVKEYAKKYGKHSIARDLVTLQKTLTDNPSNAIPIKNKVYKIRLANSALNRGKSSGYRVYYCYKDETGNIILMYIYSKKDQASLSDEELDKLMQELLDNFPNCAN